ncbi:MAG: hypothetical protein KOO62_01040 [candidate division Zixibacteria bacterium]|nr:hypothetical protein [candidate division Zixibacteria bacterium]
MIRIAGLIILVLLHWATISVAQQLSTAVYASEDELFEALELGEISFTEFLILKEIIVHGIDSTDAHLLDRVPNLSFFLSDTLERRTHLQQEQEQAFVEKVRLRHAWRVKLKYAYHQKLQTDGPARYRSLATIQITDNLMATMDIRKEYSGRERVTARSVYYRAPEKALAELKLGSYTKRLGLGNIAGYRGRLLDRSDRIDGESLVIPDYGGANGVYIHLRPGRSWAVQSMGSIVRDDQHRLSTMAAMVSRQIRGLELAGIVGSNRMTNRVSEKTVHDLKLGFFSRLGYAEGHAVMEITHQSGERDGFCGASLEGRHRFRQADIRYAAWAYDDEYLDLTSGSKTGSVSSRDSLDSIEFGFSSRRRGAVGGMFKTIVQITPQLELVNSFVGSALSRDSMTVQFLSGIISQLESGLSLRLDFLSKLSRRVSPSNSTETVDRRTRLEGRFRSGKLSLKSYFCYHTKTGRSDYLSAFLRIGTSVEGLGHVELWSNLGRWNTREKCIDYWYGYISSQQEILSDVSAAIKLSHSYRRQPLSRHETTVAMEVTAMVW